MLMYSNLTKHRKNIAVLGLLIAIVMVGLSGTAWLSYNFPLGALRRYGRGASPKGTDD